jgi:hypothetical protein
LASEQTRHSATGTAQNRGSGKLREQIQRLGREIGDSGMFEKEAWLMAALVLVPLVVGLVIGIFFRY